MSSLGWMTAVGALLLVMALSSSHVERLPISTSFIYLLIGLAIGPLGLGLLRIDMVAQREMLELLCEFAVIVSLFVGGLRLRLPLRHSSWRPALLLAGPVMIASIAGATIVAAWLLQLPIFLAILLAAMLAGPRGARVAASRRSGARRRRALTHARRRRHRTSPIGNAGAPARQ